MSKSEILYVKGMSISESDGENDVWDDRKLNDAYDKALRIANKEVAKRVAMSTNTKIGREDQSNKKEKAMSRPTSSKNKEAHWKVGMPCRAVYEGDGLEYEAFVLRIINNKECVVRFLGYENSEIVDINTLKPTLGNEERTAQIEQAMNEKDDDGFASQSPNPDDESDRAPSPESLNTLFERKNKSPKKSKKNNNPINGFQLPEMPFPMPNNLSMLRNLGSSDMPMPPPPPIAFASSDRSEAEDQAISSMLLSWYMSGYYTGLYQGMKRAK